MTEPAARPRRWWKYLLIACSVGAVVLLAALWYSTTASFQSYVRRRMVAEVERITGGRAEIGSFHVVPFHLQVEVRNITVHGKEAATDIPLAHADSLLAQVKVISFLRTEFGFYSVVLGHPIVHIAIAPDGTTNIPAPRAARSESDSTPIEQLFALSIDHLTLRNGQLLWADRNIPFDLDAHDASSQMDYSFLRGSYESHLSVGKVDSGFAEFRPFAWSSSVEFSLRSTSLDVKALTWNSGRSSVHASGRISDFRNPRLDASYQGHFDVADAGAIVRRQELREGIAEFNGSGHWSLQDFAASGALALHELGWQNDQLVLKKASANMDYSITDEQIKLSKLQGKILGGSFTGDGQIDNWLRSVPPPGSGAKKGVENLPVVTAARPRTKNDQKAKEKVLGVQNGTVHLHVRDVSAAELARAFDVPAHKLGKFRPAGLGSGNIDGFWRGSFREAEVAFAMDFTPPSRTTTGEIPVTARVQGKYRAGSDSLELATFNLSTPASRIQASGILASSSTVRISLSTSNLEEWRPLVTALGGPTNLPFRVNGNARFNGIAGGTFSSPTLAGALIAEDFEFSLPATSRKPEQQVHWDSLAGNLQYSAHDLAFRGGSLRRGDTSADFDVSAILQNGQFTENSPLTAHLNLHKVDVASTAALAGFDYPVSGTADLSVQIGGTRAHPQAGGHIHAVNASVYGESIEMFDADLRMAGSETALDNIHLSHQDAVISGNAAYTPASRAFRIGLEGKRFDLARIPQIQQSRLPVAGNADFSLQASGTLDAPVISAQLHVRDLTLDHELQGAFNLDAETKGGEMRINAHSEFPHGTFAIQGTVGMRGEYPASISASMDHLDLDALWRAYLGGQLTGHSAVGGTVTLRGPLRDPRRWTLNGNVTDVVIDVEYAKLHNQDPIRFTYADQTVQLEHSHFVGEGTDVVGHGNLEFGGNRELDLMADGQIDLRLLGSIVPNLTSAGLATIHMNLGGTLSEPFPQGTIQIKNGSALYAGLPSGLSEMNGSLTFTRDRIHIDQLTARTGGGTLDLKGDATHYNGQLSFNLNGVGKEVRLRYPPGVSSTATAELRWVGTRSASLVSGDVLVTKLAVTPGFDFGSYLERSRQSAAITPANSPLYNVKLDVAVRTAPELQMKTAVARLSGDADLRLRGSLARPSVLGRADILEGDATFNGIKFRLERGDITFANPVAIEPQVNLQATTHVRNYDLDVTVTGTPDRMTINYRSEPPLPKSDIIALLALGRTSEESEQLQQQSGQGLFNDEATALIINQAINSTVSSRMQKLFGVSRIKIDPQGLTTETNPTARGPQVTIEQQFANNITLSYSTNVSQSAQQIIQGEYYVNRNVSVVGTRDQNGVVSFDVRVRRRKK